MTYTDLTKKLDWFLKPENQPRINEPYGADSTLFKHMVQLVENYWSEQPPERYETEPWIQETDELHRKMSDVMIMGGVV